MPKACRVPTSGSDAGKYSLAKTRPVTVLYRKKSYHSIVVPIVLAITARRNCTRCSSSESGLVAIPATVIEAPPPMFPGASLHRCPAAEHLVVLLSRQRRNHPAITREPVCSAHLSIDRLMI